MTTTTGTLPPLTLAQAIARINHLRPIVMAARDDAFKKCPAGLTAMAQALMLHDDGVFTAERTIQWMRDALGIPVTPESLELGQLQAALYQGHFHGTASASEAGGQHGL
jgi:hypothetical protein